MVYRISPSERTAFKRCRREWDMSARNRRNVEPIPRPGPINLAQALRDALAVYYFPGMWEWDRGIVTPLVHQALDRSLRGQTQPDQQSLREVLDRGHALIDAYTAWAPAVDHFTPVRVNTDFEVNIPDPTTPGAYLVTPDGAEIRYSDRVDLLAIDNDDAYWVIQHRLVTDSWADHDALQLDERTIAWSWAWPQFYLGMQITGTVYNEVRADAGELGGSAPRPAGRLTAGHRRMYARSGTVAGERLDAEGTDAFSRTRIRRGEAELAAAGVHLAAEARTATRPNLEIYPSPEPDVCARCAYRPPCLILNEGGDPSGGDFSAELSRSYQQRAPEPVQEGRLGGVTWSMNRGAAPPRWPSKS